MNQNQEICIKPYALMGIILAVMGFCFILHVLLLSTMLMISRKTKADMKIIRARLDQAKRLRERQTKEENKPEPDYEDVTIPESWSTTNPVPSTPESGISMGELECIPEEADNGHPYSVNEVQQRPGPSSFFTMAIIEEPEYEQVEDTPPLKHLNKELFLFQNQAYGL